MTNEVGITVIGSGLWASTVHLPAYKAHPRARLSGGGMATFLTTFYGTGERMNQEIEIFGQDGGIFSISGGWQNPTCGRWSHKASALWEFRG